MMAPSALIIGDGLAGLGTACVLARAGWHAIIAASSRPMANARYAHGHIIAQSVLRQLEHLTGGALDGWCDVDALCLNTTDAHRDRRIRPMPLVAPAQLRESMRHRAIALGVHWANVYDITPDHTYSWHWRSAEKATHCADLLIDASGHGQGLTSITAIELIQDEMAERDVCHSWAGQGASDDSDAFLILARNVLGCDVTLSRFANGQCVMTTRGLPNPLMPTMILDAILLGSDAIWARRLGALKFAKTPVRYSAPLARITTCANADALPPVVIVGDALMQTAPRFGQGIAQLAHQLSALAGTLERGGCLSRLAQTLHNKAAAQWAGLAIAAGLPNTATVAA